MADFPLYQNVTMQTTGVVLGSSAGTTIVGGSSGHTKGTWAVLDASIPEGVVGFWICLAYPTTYRYMLDLAVGTGPTVILANLYWSNRDYIAPPRLFIPMALPPGETLWGRHQNGGGSRSVQVSIIYVIAPMLYPQPLQRSQTLAANTTDTTGLTIDPGASANTKGVWTALTASLPNDILSFILCFGNGADAYPASYQHTRWLIDIGIGPAGQEIVVVSNLLVACDAGSDTLHGNFVGPINIAIPAAKRISVRAQSTETDSQYRLIRATMIGFR